MNQRLASLVTVHGKKTLPMNQRLAALVTVHGKKTLPMNQRLASLVTVHGEKTLPVNQSLASLVTVHGKKTLPVNRDTRSVSLVHGRNLSQPRPITHSEMLKPPNPISNFYCVYVLYSLKDRKFYIGYTTNLRRRLSEHRRGESASTAPRRPLRLLFCEHYVCREDAQRRERYFKTSPGKRALRLMLKDSLRKAAAWTREPSQEP